MHPLHTDRRFLSSLPVARQTRGRGMRAALLMALVWAPSLGLISACSKASETAVAAEPTVSNNTIRFPVKAPEVQRLVTQAVTPAPPDTTTLPARLAWDEDHTARVVSPVAGRIVEALVQAGASVKAGQPLAYLASAELGTAQAEAARAQTDVDQATRNLARTKDLAEAGIVAGKDFEQAQGDLKRTRAEAQRTGLRLKSLGAGNVVDQRYALRSPIAGAVVERSVNPGMEWRPDQPAPALFVISDPTYLWCWIDAPESAIGTLQPGQSLRIRASAWPQEPVDAKIDYVADALDPTSHTLKVRARLRNPLRHLKAEMYVSAEIAGQPAGALDVASKAVFLSDGAQQVFVKTGAAQFSRKTVLVTGSGSGGHEGRMRVGGGLQPGDEVVVDGALFLQQLLEASRQTTQAPAAVTASK